jgi:hypothetical protein
MRVREQTASFRGDDLTPLVAASLACPLCLSGSVTWVLETGEWEAQAHCRCPRCNGAWAVGLNDQQALRLALQPAVPA